MPTRSRADNERSPLASSHCRNSRMTALASLYLISTISKEVRYFLSGGWLWRGGQPCSRAFPASFARSAPTASAMVRSMRSNCAFWSETRSCVIAAK